MSQISWDSMQTKFMCDVRTNNSCSPCAWNSNLNRKKFAVSVDFILVALMVNDILFRSPNYAVIRCGGSSSSRRSNFVYNLRRPPAAPHLPACMARSELYRPTFICRSVQIRRRAHVNTRTRTHIHWRHYMYYKAAAAATCQICRRPSVFKVKHPVSNCRTKFFALFFRTVCDAVQRLHEVLHTGTDFDGRLSSTDTIPPSH